MRDARRISRRGLVIGGLLATAAPRKARAQGVITFGLTPVFLTSDLELLERLKGYLEEATGKSVRLVLRRTYQEITTQLVTGQLDAAWICGFPFVANREQLQLIAVPNWNGRPLYQSYVIVDHSRVENEFARLRGDSHAFSDPNSNSGYLVTRSLLAEIGERPENFFSRNFFTFGHRNVIRAVASGLAQSGSVDGYVYDVVAELEPAQTALTRVARRSEWLGFPPIAAAKFPPDADHLARVADALLRMHESDAGKRVLSMLRLDSFSQQDAQIYDSIAAKVAAVGRSG